MNAFEIFEYIKSNTDAVVSFQEEGPTPSIYVRADFIEPVMTLLKTDDQLLFDALMSHTGFHETEDPKLFWHLFFDVKQDETNTDHTHEEIRLFWQLYSYKNNHRITIESSVPIGNPVIKSMVGLWKTADWLERESFDLLGVDYVDHPDLRRIMLPEDWEGHPLRKDYVFPSSYHGIDNTPSEITQSFEPKGKSK